MALLKHSLAAGIAIFATVAASPALAHTKAGQFSLGVDGGMDFAIDGTMHGGENVDIADLGILNPALSGIPAELQIGERSQRDVYDDAWGIGAELAYGLSDSSELFGSVRYLEAQGNKINVGQAAAGAPVNASLPVFGDFSDYKALSVELGFRQYLMPDSGISPYIAGRLGVARLSEISSTFTVPDAGITLTDTPFSDSSWVFSAGADLGLSIKVNEGFFLQPEVGLHYADGASGDDSALGGLGLSSINDSGSRLSVPVRLRAKFAF
ncbi:hypothetical protein SZ64_17965 [Erythrobacter sp. SG61-1L]|nr:hypothetical protein SZ64_17480 [Erythrobacter sp. SG61-1L]KPL69818.1 hypothetical protein SZ64_17965 [Erythrobacter sp. SG61-1L]